MDRAFNGCTNLTGTIYIESTEITGMNHAFDGTSISKIYIQKTYSNGVNTKTYNSVINAGYENLIAN